ncbi:MAG: putative ComE operon protein 2 [Prokaryotic dsDNA virus sp.]|nr:MAG: putative ComE operon protein 2 [Prokaryotic dsDNA virus sp.]
MDLAERTAQMSKDPTTQVGAVVVQDRRVVGMGYNGFPAGIPDDPKMLGDREAKLARMIHAEMNALLQAGRAAAGATLYVHGFAAPPCTRCTAHIIQAGIIHVVVAGQPAPARWVADFTESSSMLRVSGVPVTYL